MGSPLWELRKCCRHLDLLWGRHTIAERQRDKVLMAKLRVEIAEAETKREKIKENW